MPLALYVRILRRAVDGHATFRRGEASQRATALSHAWDEHWTEEPLGHLLRDAHQDRWVRFWSLPNAKRYADTDAEHAEILSRRLTVLKTLAQDTPVWVIAQDWDGRVIQSGWSRDAIPGRWPWRRSHDFAGAGAGAWVAWNAQANNYKAQLYRRKMLSGYSGTAGEH